MLPVTAAGLTVQHRFRYPQRMIESELDCSRVAGHPQSGAGLPVTGDDGSRQFLFVEQETYPGAPLDSVKRDFAYISTLEF